MKKKTLKSRFFKATTVIMVAVFTTLAFAGCEQKERSNVESKVESLETTSVEESTVQESSNQEQSLTVSKEESKEKSIEISTEESEVSLEAKTENSLQSSTESSTQIPTEELLTEEEAKEIIPILQSDDWQIFETLSNKDIVCYARYKNDKIKIELKVGDIVGIVGRDQEGNAYYITYDGEVAALIFDYFDYLPKDYVLKDGEKIVG